MSCVLRQRRPASQYEYPITANPLILEGHEDEFPFTFFEHFQRKFAQTYKAEAARRRLKYHDLAKRVLRISLATQNIQSRTKYFCFA